MSNIGELFQACDLDGSGSIDREELAAICPDLTPEEIDSIFSELDKDGDGTISISEFSKGFQGLSSSLLGLSRAPEAEANDDTVDSTVGEEKWETENSSDDISKHIASELSDMGVSVSEDLITTLSCQEQVCELYQNLHATNSPELLAQFENVILAVIKDIRQHQHDTEQLENTLKKEKELHMKQLQELEEELENQVSKLESKIRREEQEKLEQEKLELKRQLENEIAELKANMARLHQLEALKREEKPTDDIKAKLDEISEENRFLQSKLTDAQTKLALLRSELATTKQVMEEKCYELQHEKRTLMEYLKEQENLTRQVHVLHDANQRLHDTNDDLREALENSRHFTLKPMIENTSTPLNKGDYVKQYLSSPARSPVCGASLADELSMIEASKRKMLPTQDSCEADSLPEDFDSGHSTMRDGHDPDSEYEVMTPDDDYYNRRKRSRLLQLNNGFDSAAESELPESLVSPTDLETEIEMGDEDDISLRTPSRCSNCSSRASIRSTGSRRSASRRVLPSAPMVIPKVITKEPERMFKVVLAGDAAVGKSSFILRLCKDKFVNNLSSTLGVDFQTKTIELDGRVVALQLWDTAGQERFRSVARSYFRRADGVLLVYDCTYERSFLNVREWVEIVQDSASKQLPIMFVANKTDLREEFENDGRKCIRCVKTEEGERLAREYDGLFIETSAKKGDNIMEAVIELTRLMRANEDLEVQNVGMQLKEAKEKTKLVDCCTL